MTSVIDGAPVPGGRTLPSTNPARLDEVVGEVSFGDASTFVRAAESAKKAQEEWAAIPAPIRGRAIAHIGRLVEDNAEALARLVTAEIGKPYGEALGEVREIIDTCDFFLGEGRRLYGQTVPSEMPDKQLFTFRRPVGTVAVITAGNFPVAVPAWYIVPALLAGNTVVWKPAEYSAVSSAAFHELFVRGGGLPDGVFNVVHADGAATFSGLEQSLEAGLIDKVGFTGSSAVGREIGALTGRHLQTACLELGGKNPLIVTPSADLDLAVEFLQAMLRLVHAHDALFILDEVQTGVGTTGTAWAYQQLGIQPDVVAFSKKAQVGGIMAGGRVDEVPDNVFQVSGRINSTWGGGLVDMVRSRRVPGDHRGRRPHRAGGPEGRATGGRARGASR